ncbi:alpha/beta hydrolase [Aeromicrobium sp.]|uniref:alpha/beta fold hydrolase n=1 Tax=Aeromicrobium sp. TaxID=1871063 RepID=UPI0019C7FD45|nr:alpha/beta hydrolase [Aeromicrobium sp.]MBC7630226.1 alpha/beta hydrolase [Aeromicrobium sp.]
MTYHRTTPVTAGDLIFDVRQTGPDDGEPVLLLHGFPETSLSWSAVAPLLTDAGLRVFAPDQRGYSPGARPTEVSDYAPDVLAGDVVALADSLGLDTFHLVGHDWGAAVAWCVAAQHPGRLRSLTAVSVPHLAAYGAALQSDPDQQQRASYIGLLRQVGKAEELLLADDGRRLIAMYGDDVPTQQVAAYVAHLSEPGALTAALNWYRAMTNDLSSLPTVQVPTTFVWSDEDMAIGRLPAEQCGDFVDADYRFVELSGISHWIPEQAPAALAEAIIARTRD